MKRPLTVSSFAFAAGAFMVSLFNVKIALFLCGLLLLAFIICLFIKQLRNVAALTAVIFLVLGISFGEINLYPTQTMNVEKLSGATVENAEFVSEEQVTSSRTVGKLKLSDSESVTVLVTGTLTEPFEEYKLSGTLEPIIGQYKNYYLARGACLQITPDEITDTGKSGGSVIIKIASAIRNECSEKLYEYLPQKEASIIDAVLLGNKAALTSNLMESFRTSGAAHIAVVSGLHLSVVTSIVFGIMFFLTRRRRLSSAVSIIAVICFMLITGLNISVVRAGIMSIIMLCGVLFARRGDSLNNLGAAVLLITLFNPLAVFDLGFQLSVASTFGIITLAPYFIDGSKKYFTSKLARLFRKFIITPVAITLSAFIVTAPILIINFEYIGIYFIITNIVLSFAVPILLLFSMMFIIFVFIPFCGFIAYPAALLSGITAKLIAATVETVSAFPGARFEIDLIYSTQIVITLVLIVAVIGIIRRTRKSVIRASACAALAFCVILCAFAIYKSDSAELSLISTGDGITAIFEKNGESAVIACGGTSNKSTLQTELYESGNRNLVTIKGATRECAGLFGIVKRSCFSDNYYIQDSDYNKNTLKVLDETITYTYSDINKIRLWNSLTVHIIPLCNSTALVIELDSEYILILPNTEYAEDIPSEFKNPKLLISTKPVDTGEINADNTIIACSREHELENLDNVVYNDKTISLYQCEKISVNMKDKILYIKKG